MKILIAGPYNSGGNRLLECYRTICKICNIPIKYGSYVSFNTKVANEFQGIYIIKCNELHEMIFNVSFFDIVLVPIRDVRYFCKTEHEALMNIALYECWKIQATQIVKYEEFDIQQILNIFKTMNIRLEDNVVGYMEKHIENRYENKNYKIELLQKNQTIETFLQKNKYL